MFSFGLLHPKPFFLLQARYETKKFQSLFLVFNVFVGITGEENPHFIEKITSGSRQSLTFFFTCDKHYSIWSNYDLWCGHNEVLKISYFRRIIQDLIAIRESTEAYPPIWLELSRKSNDLFLKSQGVKSGIKSYQQLPMLAAAWRQRMNAKK